MQREKKVKILKVTAISTLTRQREKWTAKISKQSPRNAILESTKLKRRRYRIKPVIKNVNDHKKLPING
jgi:hypothetical protein